MSSGPLKSYVLIRWKCSLHGLTEVGTSPGEACRTECRCPYCGELMEFKAMAVGLTITPLPYTTPFRPEEKTGISALEVVPGRREAGDRGLGKQNNRKSTGRPKKDRVRELRPRPKMVLLPGDDGYE